MRPQRPAAPTVRLGVVACVAGVGVLVAACGPDTVEIGSVQTTPADRATCRSLLAALPEKVADQPRRRIEPEAALGAAWGDPAIVLRCAVPTPDLFDRFATCQETNGVGWFVPDAVIEDQGADVVMTTIGRELNVEVEVPAQYRPPAAVMVDLAPSIKQTVRETDPCL